MNASFSEIENSDSISRYSTDITIQDFKEKNKPFYYIEYSREINILKRIKSILGIFLLSLTFTGFVFFIFLFFYGNFYSKIFLICFALIQNFITKRSNLYYDFIKNLMPSKYFRSFKIIIEEKPDDYNCLFPSVPHGIFTLGMSISILNGHSFLKKCELLGTRNLIYLPFSGLLARMLGISGVNNKNFVEFMKQRKNIIFIPGGYECSTVTNINKDRVFLKSRKGFIKYSLIYGYKIYPVYNFGENKLFYTSSTLNEKIEKIGLFLNKMKFPGVVFFGKYFFLPFSDVDLSCVIGKGIQMPKISNPTKDQINYYHEMYMKKFKELYNKYKNLFKASNEIEII